MRILLFVILFVNLSYSQTTAFPISDENYQEKKRELDYHKTKKGLSLRKSILEKIKNLDTEKIETTTPRSDYFGDFGLKGIAYVAVVFLIIAIIYMVFVNVKIDQSIIPPTDEGEEIKDIEDIDTDTEYQKAVADGNYKLAIRMQFIKILQILTQKEIIEWQNEKTNRDYIREIKDRDTKTAFRTNSNYYEKAWYGDEAIDFSSFRSIDQNLTDFINKIS